MTDRERRLKEVYAQHSRAWVWSVKICAGLVIAAVFAVAFTGMCLLYRAGPWMAIGFLAGVAIMGRGRA